MNDSEYNQIIWRAALSVLKAFGIRHGFCKDIEVVK